MRTGETKCIYITYKIKVYKVPVQTVRTSNSTNIEPVINVGLRKTNSLILRFKKKLFPFIDWSSKNLAKGTEFLPETQILSSLYLCNLVMVL